MADTPVERGSQRRPGTRLWLALALVSVIVVGGAGLAYASLSRPSLPACEVQRPGFDRSLEALIPGRLEGGPPARLDSGEHCTPSTLGTLASHGLTRVSFAGGLWDLAPQTGITLVVYRAAGLDADWIAEFYEVGARTGIHLTNLVVTHPTIDSRPGTRLDYRDSDEPGAILVWPAPQPGTVRVILAAGLPERVIGEAIAAFDGG